MISEINKSWKKEKMHVLKQHSLRENLSYKVHAKKEVDPFK